MNGTRILLLYRHRTVGCVETLKRLVRPTIWWYCVNLFFAHISWSPLSLSPQHALVVVSRFSLRPRGSSERRAINLRRVEDDMFDDWTLDCIALAWALLLGY